MPLRRHFLRLVLAALLLALPGVTAAPSAAAATDVPRITKEALKARLDDPKLVILDVRTGSDWKGSEYKLPGAVRLDPGADMATATAGLDRKKEYVLYCA